MKILHVVPYFYPVWAYGGPPRVVYEISKRQTKLGHQVTILTTDAYEKDKRLSGGNLNIEGIRVIRIKNLSNYVMWKFHFCTPLNPLHNINVNSFDVIHLHEGRTLLNALVLIKVRYGKKIVFSPWGTFDYNNRLIPLKRLFDSLFLQQFQKKIQLSTAQNNHELTTLAKFGVGRAKKILPLGIDSNFFNKIPSREEARKKMGVDKDYFVFLFLGNFREVKVGPLLKTFSIFAEGKKHIKLILVGRDDGFLDKMKKQIIEYGIEDKVIIFGPMYGKDRLYAYAAANAFIYTPTVYEETSGASQEALICGVPVIITLQSELPYMGAQDGIFQIKNNINEITRTVEVFYTKRIKANPLKLRKYFDWDNVTKLLEEYLKL